MLFCLSLPLPPVHGIGSCQIINITVHSTTPACSAFRPTLHPKRGIKLFRREHSWDSRGTAVQHHCQLQAQRGWRARDVFPSCLSWESLSPFHHPGLGQRSTEMPMAKTARSIHLLSALCALNSSQHHPEDTDECPVPGVPMATLLPAVLLHQHPACCSSCRATAVALTFR